MSLPTVETVLQKACEDEVIPGAVVLAATKDQGVVYSKSFGRRSFEKGEESEPMKIDDVMALYSGSKLITAIAAVQLGEKGLFDLDEDVTKVLPELADLKVLTGIDHDGKPIAEERVSKITLRQMITHSSGLMYGFISPLIQKYNESEGLPDEFPWTTTIKSFSAPLVAQPGTAWNYGTGLEWAGLLISRVTGMTLEEYTQKYIASPLGIEDMTYFPYKNPSITSRMVSMTKRDPSGKDGNGRVIPNTDEDLLGHVQEELGGVGVYTSMPSLLQILYSLLADDEKLLKKETAAQVFEPQLTPASQKSLQTRFDHIPKGEERSAPPYVGTFPQVQYHHGLGGMLSMENVDSGSLQWRRKGFFFWSGMPNIFWFIDREAGLCAVFGTQVLPIADEQIRKLINVYEKELYSKFATRA